jgi:ATP-dependent RNA helicase DDX35
MGDFDINSTFIPALYKPAELLPIAKYEREIQYIVETRQVVVVVGPTGSGKTTQIPQFLRKAGWCANGQMIAITQVRPPQRSELVAAIYPGRQGCRWTDLTSRVRSRGG